MEFYWFLIDDDDDLNCVVVLVIAMEMEVNGKFEKSGGFECLFFSSSFLPFFGEVSLIYNHIHSFFSFVPYHTTILLESFFTSLLFTFYFLLFDGWFSFINSYHKDIKKILLKKVDHFVSCVFFWFFTNKVFGLVWFFVFFICNLCKYNNLPLK